LPTPRSYWFVLINQGNNTNKEEEKKLFSTQLYTLKLSLQLSLTVFLSVFSHFSALYLHSSSMSIYVRVKGINHAMIYAHRFVSSTMCQVGD
jgi:hypothetical protein